MSVASDSPTPVKTATQPLAAPVASPASLERLPFLITMAAGLIAILTFAVYGFTALIGRDQMFFGAMLSPFMVVDGSRSVVSDGWPGLVNGLHWQDQVIAINDEPLFSTAGDYAGARQRFLNITRSLPPGSEVTVTVRRSERDLEAGGVCGAVQDGFRECQIRYSVDRLPNTDFLTYFIIPFIAGLITAVIGIIVAYLRPRQLAAQLIGLFSMLFGVFMGGLFDINNTYAVLPLWLLATALVGGPLGMLALNFPVRQNVVYRFPAIEYLPLLVSAVIAVGSLLLYFNPPAGLVFADTWQPGIFFALLMLILFAVNLFRQRATAISPAVRDQVNTLLIGLALTLTPTILWLVDYSARTFFKTPFLSINSSAMTPFFVMPTIALAYAVLQYRWVNTDRVISRGVTYSLLLLALIFGYSLLVMGANFVMRQAVGLNSNEILVALTIFIIALLFLPIRSYLQQRIDAIYFRKRADYQARAETFASRLGSVESLDEIVSGFRQEMEQTLSASNVLLFLPDSQAKAYRAYGNPRPETDIRFDASSSLIAYLNKEEVVYLDTLPRWPDELIPEKTRLNILKAAMIVRLRGRKDLIGFICIGGLKQSNRRYSYEEVRYIQLIAGQLSLAVERSQVVDSLERRVRELDVLSSVSQAVNYTIEFDDLLELIYAQTDKLISSPYFYIALQERGSEKLFFAFFVEDNERYSDRENRRWLMGRDLFSEVVRTSLPIVVDDYANEMNRRSSTIIYESLDLKGWVGVPLIAGSSTLGVLAAATTDPTRKFTDEQIKIFSNISTLAATSIEKARLFAETNERARQLRALNEISQRLASELKVDNLLQLITESAVTILNAEAGSLLLQADDDPDLMEFKVVVGNSSQHLIGKRFPRNKGIIGEAAMQARPVIVNDAANDPRWGGEVTSGSFNTTAVLAVPLVAQNRVFGILEVLNKKGGGGYLTEDAELLTTFAGQAAVAIENARLFQMTDLQLEQRVNELQALERIDVELNRSLDLQRVADITMKWAVSNTSANAGVLGMIVGEDVKRLRVLSLHGYKESDYPEGVEDGLWPLDRGVVKRVLRTRQPDLVTNPEIDPDYVPSLRGSLSQMTIPMMSGSEIIALLVLEKDREPRLNLVDMSFVTRLAEHASIAIANAQINAALTQANDSKSQFVAFVAHELKNPMTSMKGFGSIIAKGTVGPLNEQQQNFMDRITANIDRVITIINDLEDVEKVARKQLNMNLAALDFHLVLNETLLTLQKQIEDKGQTLNLRVPDNLPPILADRNRMIQVLTNLISNAWKYSPHDTQITITAEVLARNPDNKGRDRGPALKVSVKDQGMGMSEEDLKQLFKAYFRARNAKESQQPGTGLGLTITRGIVESHGGDINVESTLNEGTTFSFTVPLAPEEMKETAKEPQMAK